VRLDDVVVESEKSGVVDCRKSVDIIAGEGRVAGRVVCDSCLCSARVSRS